jgi:hypothetical protein
MYISLFHRAALQQGVNLGFGLARRRQDFAGVLANAGRPGM